MSRLKMNRFIIASLIPETGEKNMKNIKKM